MDKAEEIRATIANVDSEIIKDALSIILAKEPSQSIRQKNGIDSTYKNFAQVILSLKKQYKFPELNFFSVEADLVYVTTGDRRLLLTDKDKVLKQSDFLKNNIPSKISPDKFDSPKQELNEDSIANAFEPIKNNESRFSHLEL